MDFQIVVVDDEALSLTNARMLLSENGMKVNCLRSGNDLLKYMQKHTPDLILLDVMMPDMDGFETYHALRELEDGLGKSNTHVIFLTGENDSEVERRGLKAGASDFIHKPFNQDILIRRIHNTITNNKTIESLMEEVTVDKLTGFLNKASGTKRISELTADSQGALMILDLDSFKLVNDLFGHDMGDKVLQAFADVIRYNTRADDVVSRIGGDEFMAFFRNVAKEEEVAVLTRRLNEQLVRECAALMGEDFGIPIGISVGAVFVPVQGTDFQGIFQYADSSLYKVKQNGKHGYAIYDPEAEFTDDGEDLADEIRRVTKLVEERNDGSGALLLGRDAFADDYRFIMRYIKRYKGKATKLLFAVRAREKEKDISKAVAAFGEALQDALRKSDIITQNKPNQFFLLLTDMSDEDVATVVERIMNAWRKSEFYEWTEVQHVSECVSFEE